jgi:negative regulator of sigma E activity
MPQSIGKTYGFGRVSPETRPSPYTPMFLASVAPDIAPAADVAPKPVRPRRRRRFALALTIAVAVAASVIVAVGLVRSASRTTAARAPDAPVAARLALDGEAERLARSAFAAHRGTGAR